MKKMKIASGQAKRSHDSQRDNSKLAWGHFYVPRMAFVMTASCLEFVLSVAVFAQSPSSSPALSEPKATLRISTHSAVLMHKQIHSASTADTFYSRNPLAPHDILADPFFSQVKALNLQSLGFEQDASAVHHHVVVGDTRVYGGKGDGYNISAEETRARGLDIAEIVDGVGAHHFGKDFFNEYCAMLEKLGIPGAVTVNTRSGTLDEVLWEIERAHAERVVFGLEQVTRSHSSFFPTGKTYVEKVTPWVRAVKNKYPNVVTVLDAAWETRPAHLQWNRDLQAMEGDQVRIYLWDRDLYGPVKAKDAASRINDSFTKVLPQMIAGIQKTFPNKKISVLQWGLKPGGQNYNTVFGCLHVAKMYQWLITFNRENANLIDYASFTNLKNLLLAKQGVSCHYYALKLCGQLFEGAPKVLEASVTGADGVHVLCCEQNGKFMLLQINANSREITIPSVLVDGAPTGAKSFRKEAIYGKNLETNQIAHEEGTSQIIALKPYSVSIIRF